MDLKVQNGLKKKTGQKKIPPGAWMSVSCECCVLGRGICDELVTRLEESYRLSKLL